MGQFVAAFAKDLRRLGHDRVQLGTWLLIPLLVCGLMHMAFAGTGGAMPVARVLLVDSADSFGGYVVEAAAKGELASGAWPFAELIEVERVSESEGRARIDRGEASALLMLPPGLATALAAGEAPAVELVTDPSRRVLPGVVAEALEHGARLVTRFVRRHPDALARAAADGALERRGEWPALAAELSAASTGSRPALEGDLLVVSKGEGSLLALLFPGFVLMALCFLAESLSADIWRERQAGALARALSAPGRAAPLVLGKVGAGTLLMAVVALTTAAAGVVLFGLEPGSLVVVVATTPIFGAVLMLGFLALHVHAQSQRAGNVIGALLLFPLLLVGGSFFPVDAMPSWLAAVGRVTPNGWVLARLQAVVVDGASASLLLAPLAALLVVGAAFALLVLARLSRFAQR